MTQPTDTKPSLTFGKADRNGQHPLEFEARDGDLEIWINGYGEDRPLWKYLGPENARELRDFLNQHFKD